MSEQIEKVEKHLYQRTYQTGSGEVVTKYYARFTCWDGINRTFPVGESESEAKGKLGELRRKNYGEYDFDREKREREKVKKAMTLSAWLDRYLDLVKDTQSGGTKKAQCAHLKRLLGHLLLSEINRVRIIEYKNRRLSESLIRHGNPVEGTRIQGATVNREVSCLTTALNLASDEGLCDGAPRVKKERETPRERTLTDDEYRALLEASPRWLQRLLIGANETAIDQGVLLRLTWDSMRDGLIKAGRDKTGVRQRVGISPALNAVLDELRAEYRRIPNTDKRVFTKGGKPIHKAALRHAFDKAVGDAKVQDFVFKDFRHCARTRWASLGLPFEIGEIGIGHKIRGVAGKYINLTDDQIRNAFQEMFQKFATGLRQEAASDAR
ncbi:MAG: tyrosine-type recombinase/integrase [Candidatus Binatia bacterium]